MKITYLYSGCSPRKYHELFNGQQVMILQQNQKYHSLMVRGLHENGAEVEVESGLPVNRELTKSFYIPAEREIQNGVKYRYFATINYSLPRRVQLVVKSFWSILRKNKNTIIVADVLDASAAIGALIAAKLRGIKTVGIVTDVPGRLSDSTSHKSLLERMRIALLNKFNGYVFLTEAMNAVVNTKKRPYIVLEGHVDSAMQQSVNSLENKSQPKVMMYAGSLKKVYGIGNLTAAFIAAVVDGWELHIYGDGDFRADLEDICKKYPSIKYMGIKLNHEIVDAELRATLLVNPRPTHEEYTRYSFPSKNMEYMASGTPLLTTRLPGMPKEYDKYVYTFDDESIPGMTRTLCEILSKDASELHKKGAEAKAFVLSDKNEIVQSAKLLNLISTPE